MRYSQTIIEDVLINHAIKVHCLGRIINTEISLEDEALEVIGLTTSEVIANKWSSLSENNSSFILVLNDRELLNKINNGNLFEIEFAADFKEENDAMYPREILARMLINKDISKSQFEEMTNKKYIYPKRINFK